MSRFSHRNNYKDLPAQLKLETLSTEFRTRLLLGFQRLLEAFESYGVMGGSYINKSGEQFYQDLWVKELRQTRKIEYTLEALGSLITKIINHGEFHEVFDLIEFSVEFAKDSNFQQEITDAFISERLAYRFKNAVVIAVGTEEQAKTLERAFDHLEKSGAESATSHLHQASRLLAQGDYGGSLRESISAVESVARKIEPTASSLGQALNKLHKSSTPPHSALNEAFKKLYGYASDTEGVRHSLIDEKIAPVSEQEALFMLGACSAFIPYLASFEEKA